LEPRSSAVGDIIGWLSRPKLAKILIFYDAAKKMGAHMRPQLLLLLRLCGKTQRDVAQRREAKSNLGTTAANGL
jgi:hypothetical protein